jgi:hypothetical protein
MVMDRTNIAPIRPRPRAMMIGSEVMANAPITPSKENEASSTSRYMNRKKPALPLALASSDGPPVLEAEPAAAPSESSSSKSSSFSSPTFSK